MRDRIFGLDILRSIAILLVMVSHLRWEEYMYYKMGFYGVELFFVLSGFLIGKILIKEIYKEKSFNNLKKFWVRRWLRTLPAYYSVLIFLNVIKSPNIIHWKHFLFLQNFFPHTSLNWFPVSWSLSVEEWFYLVIPAFLFFLPSLFYKNKMYFILLLVFIIIIYALFRFIYTIYNNPDYDLILRKSVFFRLDSLLIGVLLAYVNICYVKIFKIVGSLFLFIVSIFVFVLFNTKFNNVLVYDFVNEKTIPASIGFTITSILFSVYVSFFYQNKFINCVMVKNRILYNLLFYISIYSYGLYLIHLDVFYLTYHFLNLSGISYYFVSVLLSFFFAGVLYNLIEKPFLKLRDIYFN